MAFKMKGFKYPGKSPAKNYKNPQDYKVFNMGNKPSPMKVAGEWEKDELGDYIQVPRDQEITGEKGRHYTGHDAKDEGQEFIEDPDKRKFIKRTIAAGGADPKFFGSQTADQWNAIDQTIQDKIDAGEELTPYEQKVQKYMAEGMKVYDASFSPEGEGTPGWWKRREEMESEE